MDNPENIKIHDNELIDLIARLNFTQAIFYTWTKRFPTEQEEAMFNACLIAIMDHGPEALTAKTARLATSGGAEMYAATAAGLLAAGKHHGTTPLQEATVLFREVVRNGIVPHQLVSEYLRDNKRVPGYGHKIYKDTDPRTEALYQKATALGFVDQYVNLAREIEKELAAQKGTRLCLNVDGMIASLLPGLGIDSDTAPGIFLVGRTVGLVWHILEEQKEKPVRLRSS